MNNTDAQPPETGDGSVRLIASARFFTAAAALPRGIRARDLRPMAGGLVEENSPLPLEQTAWGYLADNGRKGDGSIRYFAAPRTVVFGDASAKQEADPRPVLPAFAALHGFRVKTPTWLFLADGEGVAAVLLRPGSAVPARVASRFAEDDSVDDASLWRVRDELAEDCLAAQEEGKPEETISNGLLRAVGSVGKKGRGILFLIERQAAPGEPWKPWQRLEIRAPAQVLGADLRDHEQLESSHRTNRSSQRILVTAGVFAIAVFALAALELLQLRRNQEAADLQARIEARAPDVERLQEIEVMYKALDAIFRTEFIPFDWLMAVNEHRPPEISFTSYGIETGTDVTIQGQAREVGFINAFAENLMNDPRFASVDLSEVLTVREGATFRLRIAPGDINAERPEPSAESASAAADSETNAEREDS